MCKLGRDGGNAECPHGFQLEPGLLLSPLPALAIRPNTKLLAAASPSKSQWYHGDTKAPIQQGEPHDSSLSTRFGCPAFSSLLCHQCQGLRASAPAAAESSSEAAGSRDARKETPPCAPPPAGTVALQELKLQVWEGRAELGFVSGIPVSGPGPPQQSSYSFPSHLGLQGQCCSQGAAQQMGLKK